MADIKTVRIGGTSYNIIDANAVSNVSYNASTGVVTVSKQNGTSSTFTIESGAEENLKHWTGTKAQYNAIENLDNKTVYITTDEPGEDYINAAKLQTILASYVTNSTLNNHINNHNNPHQVTAAQIGAVSATNLTNHINNHNNPHQVTLSQLSGASTTDLSNHTTNTSNPHQVTAAQINTYTKSQIDEAIESALGNITHIYSGTTEPASSLGSNGDIYIKYTT